MNNKRNENKDDLSEFKIEDLLNSVFNDIEETSIGNKKSTGIPVNFYDFDAITQGLSPGNLYIIGGRPAMGKTSFVLNIAKNISQINNLPICFFSLETSQKMLCYRLLSMETGIESGRLRTGRLTQEEWPIVGEAIYFLNKNPIYLIDKALIQVSEIHKICKKVKNINNQNIGAIFIDFLQLIIFTL